VTTGAFCCQKFCICKDYIMLPDSGELGTPAGCDPNNGENECCNLAGRRGNAAYPRCH
jgi:hypothetical protein